MGHCYEGHFKNDFYEGEGKYRWPDQDEYEGAFMQGMQNGYGSFNYGNGDRYLG